MAEVISHKGRVTGCEGGKVSVEIVSESACAACHAAGLCTMAESSKKIIEVPLVPGESYVTGQEVEVCLARKSGLKAVLFSYVIPVMFLLILIFAEPTANDQTCSIVCIVTLAVPYAKPLR